MYRLYFSLGKDPETGRYLRSPKRTFHCKSKNPKNWSKECENALSAYRTELEGSRKHENGSRSVSEYAENFHALRKGTFKSPLAYKREGDYIRHICALFRDIRLSDLRPDDIRHAYADARKDGMSDGELHGTHVKLRQILQDAVDNEIIERNPCTPVKLSKPTYRERKPLPTKDASRFLTCLLKEPLSSKAAGTMLLLQCGLRRGEMLGMTWGDYSAENRTLKISKQYTNDKTLRPPKSKMSRRTIAVNETLIDYLNQWKSIQRKQLGRYGLDQNESTPIVNGIKVVTTDDGKHATIVNIDGHNFDRWFRDFCVDNGFGSYENVTGTFLRNGKKHVRGTGYTGLVPHALRHTQATLLIGEGADVKTVQARLGHASPNTTLAIYSHAIEANDRKAADTFARILAKGR
ncbi:MAG: site-specific integrase [Coriobacteriaceae bacterium]|nr:MAG: site-specific integrase [Coriobacteriaceae bacterium]